MSAEPSARRARRLFHPAVVGGVLVGGFLAWYLFAYGTQILALPFHPHAPDLSLIAAAPLAIQVHIAAALTAFAIGSALLIGVKGTTTHRTLGWTWVGAMGTTAGSSFFIHQINPDGFSFVHLISGWTVIVLPMGVYAARRHDVKAHRSRMVGLFVGGLVVAGLLTFLPGRMMWHVFFG